jgi:hypothetical protein
MAELHTLLDDGVPNCSCGKHSNRGLHYHYYTDHALQELRKRVTDLEDGMITIAHALMKSPIIFDASVGQLKDSIAQVLLEVGIDPHTGKEVNAH